jgi:hypothetical protein
MVCHWVAQSPGIQTKRKGFAGRGTQARMFNGNETAAPVVGEKPAGGEEARLAARVRRRKRPHH